MDLRRRPGAVEGLIVDFVMQFQHGAFARINLPKLQRYLGLRAGDFARLLHVHRNTLREPDSRKAQAGARSVLNVLSVFAAAGAANAKDEAWPAFHFRNRPLRALGHRTALAALSEPDPDVDAIVRAAADDLEKSP